MSTTRPFAFNNTGTTYSNTVQYGNITVANEGCDLGTIPLEWYNGCDEDPGYVIAHVAGQRNIGNNSYVSNGNVVGFWRSTAKTESSFYNLYESFRNRTGWPYMTTAADAKNWLLNNGYWTSYGSGGGYGGSGTWLLGVDGYGFQPAWDNGTITFPIFGSSIGANDMNVLSGLTSGVGGSSYGIYINGLDSSGTDKSTFLAQAIGHSGTLTITQGSVSAVFTFTNLGFASNAYDTPNGIDTETNSAGQVTLTSVTGGGVFTGFNGSGSPENSQLVTVTLNITG